MAYKLRMIQKFHADKKKEFLELEKKFMTLERDFKDFPRGKRYLPYSGRESQATLIWECEFPTLESVQSALSFLEMDTRHEELYTLQVQYFMESYIEIYELLEE